MPYAPSQNWLDANRARESGGNPYAKNSLSSAYGPDQFIDSTWLNLAKKYRPDLYTKLGPQELLNRRSDPKLSEEFTGYNNQENKTYLTNKGAAWTDQNAALAHRFGPSKTMELLSGGNPNIPIEEFFGNDPKVMAQNPDLKGKTVGEVINSYSRMFDPLTAHSNTAKKGPMAQAMQGPTMQDARSALGVTGPQMGALGVQQEGIQAPTNESVTGPSMPSGGQSKGYDWGNALLGVGAGLSSIDNPQGAAIALGMLRDRKKEDSWDFVKGKNGLYRVNKRTGSVEPVGAGQNGDMAEEDSDWDKPMKKAVVKRLEENQTALTTSNTKLSKLAQLGEYTRDPGVYQGFGGDAVGVLKSMGAAWGLNIEGNDETQAAKSLMNQFALATRNPSAGEGMPGALSDNDLKFIKASNPSLSNSAEGNRKIIDWMTKIEKKNMLMKKEESKFLSSHRTLDGLAEHMEEFRNSIDMFQEEKAPEGDSSVIDYKDL